MLAFDVVCSQPLPTQVGLFPFVLIPELQKLKKELNDSKHKLDDLENNPTLRKQYEKFATKMYPFRFLKKELTNKAPEHIKKMVTKAHLKMRELMNYIRPWIASKAAESHLLTFHAAEAPGAFVPALEIFLQDYKLRWEWYAESYIDIYAPFDPSRRKGENQQNEGHYLGDQFSFMHNTRDHWLSGSDSDGDITSSANIISFNHFFRSPYRLGLTEKFLGSIASTRGTATRGIKITNGKKAVKLGLCDLITSDVKVVPIDNDYDEEENQNYAVQLGQVMLAIKCTQRGGYAILKFFTFFEASSICLLWLLTSTFEKVTITKPVTSTHTNSETYIVCFNRLYDLETDIEQRVFKTLDDIRFRRTYNILFPPNTLPKEIIDTVIKIETQLVDKQIVALEILVDSFHHRDKLDMEKIEAMQQKLSHEWYKENISIVGS